MSTLSARAGQYFALCKPKVVALIVFTAIVGALMATPTLPPLAVFGWATLGIALAASSAAALNQLIDQRADAIMSRTQHRPLPRGEIPEHRVLLFALLLAAVSMVVLVWQINVLTAVLTFASLIGYAVIYTVFLKRATSQNIVIGGAAGAAPPVLGWAAVTNTVDPHALLLFLIIFVWTPPHFWALAVYRRDDYANVDIPMLPVTHGVGYTLLHILLYTVLLILVTLLPWLVGMSGLFYLSGALLLGGGFLYYAIQLYRTGDDMVAMKTFGFSVYYLMALFAFLLIDHYLPAFLYSVR
jgi:protoheme IX farnesyltransferase